MQRSVLAIVSAKMYLNNAYAQERAARWFARLKPGAGRAKTGGQP